mmetsp:Transcript_6908/g.16771  ORF Transcript_6908/g.16771 Transcript_6908/m.16771 type:complete len:201 (-) Transcript_6908:385-987(-)
MGTVGGRQKSCEQHAFWRRRDQTQTRFSDNHCGNRVVSEAKNKTKSQQCFLSLVVCPLGHSGVLPTLLQIAPQLLAVMEEMMIGHAHLVQCLIGFVLALRIFHWLPKTLQRSAHAMEEANLMTLTHLTWTTLRQRSSWATQKTLWRDMAFLSARSLVSTPQRQVIRSKKLCSRWFGATCSTENRTQACSNRLVYQSPQLQ